MPCGGSNMPCVTHKTIEFVKGAFGLRSAQGEDSKINENQKIPSTTGTDEITQHFPNYKGETLEDFKISVFPTPVTGCENSPKIEKKN